MVKNELFERARSHYGLKQQVIVAIEELSELQKELTKFLRLKADYDHIAEEIADVEICCEELKQYFKLHNIVGTWKSQKLQRLQSRIDYNTPANDDSLRKLQERYNFNRE